MQNFEFRKSDHHRPSDRDINDGNKELRKKTFLNFAYGFTPSEACSNTSFCRTEEKFTYLERPWKEDYAEFRISKIGPPQAERSRY